MYAILVICRSPGINDLCDNIANCSFEHGINKSGIIAKSRFLGVIIITGIISNCCL